MSCAHFARRPFPRLVSHFLARLVRGGSDAQSTEFELGVGGLLGLLACPGAFTCFILFDKYSSFLNSYLRRLRSDIYLISIPDKYLFLSLAMAVTGILTALKWDKILPDSQDYLNLAPLPVRPYTVLLANAAAIAIAVLVFAVDVNAVSTVLYPLFVISSVTEPVPTLAQYAAFSGTHFVCVVLASVFTFCAVFAALGLLSALLPQRVFRACGSWLRGLVVLAFLVLLLTSSAGPVLLRQVHRAPGSATRWLPSLWYLGLYQNLQHRATAATTELARFGLWGVAAALVVMLASGALSYRRRYAAVLESASRPRGQRLFGLALGFLDLFAARAAGFQRACHRFVVRAMLRSESHRLCLAVAVGLGGFLALQSDLYQAPLVAAYLLILGLRIGFDIPAGVPAGWVFRATLDPRQNRTLPVARRVIAAFVVPVVLLPTLAITWWRANLAAAALHTLYVLALSICLVEVLLASYRKIPFTCPLPGFRDNFLMLCLVQFLGFELFTRAGAAVERWILADPVRFLLVPAAMAAAWMWNVRRLDDARQAGELEEGLTFENVTATVVERLDLFDAS